MSDSFEAAQDFYFEMLERELALAKKESAASELRKLLRLRVIKEDELRRPVDPLTGREEIRRRLALALAQRLTSCDVRLDGETGELISWYLDFLAAPGDESMDRDEAIALATRVAEPPGDTRLDHAEYESMADRTMFRARWSHHHGGLPVEGDYIEVLVNAKARAPFSLTRFYRVPNVAKGPRP
jgi:hypothetical protein